MAMTQTAPDSDALDGLSELVTALGGDAVDSVRTANGELTVFAAREQILTLVRLLRDHDNCKFQTLIDICGVDYPERDMRFEVVYHLLSMRLNQRIRIKVQTDEQTPVPSLTGIFPGADWYEREAFDMYGIQFADHPDLRRLLTDYGFEGYPLRKDFPLTGHTEVRYDDLEKRVIYEPVKLTQEYRDFDFLSPWEGMQSVIPGDEKADEEADANG